MGWTQSADAFLRRGGVDYLWKGRFLRGACHLNFSFHRMKTPRNSRSFISCQDAADVLPKADTELCSLSDWIQLIHQAWTQGADRALELGRLMSRARQSLPHGSWSRLWQSGGLPFSKRKGEMLVVIGQGVGELDAQNSAQLPPVWNTLYYLARLGRAVVEQLIQQGRVHPELSLRQAQALLSEHHPGAQRKTPRSKLRDRLTRLAVFVRTDLGNWSQAEREWFREQLLVLAGEIQRNESTNGSHIRRVELDPFPSRHLAQFTDEHLVSPAVPNLFTQVPQRQPIPIPV
jgi:hypothetical protein